MADAWGRRAGSAIPASLLVLAFGALIGGIALGAAAVLAVALVERFAALGALIFLGWLLAMAMAVRMAMAPAGWRHGPIVAAACLLGVALALRLVSLGLAQGVALGADPMNYANLGRAVLEGRGLVTDDWRYGEDLRAYFPPLYPLVLAGTWAIFGVSPLTTLALNTAIDAVAALALADVGRRQGWRGGGWLAGLAYLAWPAFALAAGVPQKEGLTLLLAILLLRGLVIWLEQPEPGHPGWRRNLRSGLWLGLWWGLLALTQPSLALAPVAFGLVVWWQAGLVPALRLGLATLPTLLLVLAPWWLRNWLVLGAFVPFTTASGMMLNSALNDLRAPFPPGLFDLPEHERGAIMAEKARSILAQDPIAALSRMARNIAVGFAYEEAALSRFRHTTPPITAQDHARLFLLLQGSHVALLASALAATWGQWRYRLHGPVLLCAAALLLSILAINPWFEFGERHRQVLTPFLLLMAAAFWSRELRPARPLTGP